MWKRIVHPPLIVLVLLILFSLGVKLYYVDQYPVYEDEVISVMAAEGIAKHWTPTLPSGLLYQRSLLYHYILAVPIALFGTSELSIRIPSILFSLVTIFVVYLLVSHLANRWSGILAATFLVFSHMEMDFALSARMYMAYQMLTVLAAYCFIRGYIEQSRTYQWLCLFAIIAMLFTHRLAVLVLGVMAFYLFVQEGRRMLRNPIIWKSALLIIPTLYFVFLYKFPNYMSEIIVHPRKTGDIYTALTKFNFTAITYYPTNVFLRAIPYSLPIFLAGLGWIVWKKDNRLTFLYLLVLLPTLLITFIDLKYISYAFNLFALYLSVVCITLGHLWMELKGKFKADQPLNETETSKRSSKGNYKIFAWAVNIAGILLLTGYALVMYAQDRPAYGLNNYNPFRVDGRPAHLFVKKNMRSGDVVMTSNPWVTYYYLREFDFLIRQKFYNNMGWDAFPVERDEYFGKIIVDTLQEFQDIIRNPSYQRIWIIIDGKLPVTVESEMITYIARNFQIVYGKDKRGSVLIGLNEKVVQ